MENKNQSKKQNSKMNYDEPKKLSNQNIEDEEIDLDKKIKVKPSTNGEHYKSNYKRSSDQNKNSNSKKSASNSNKNENSTKSLTKPNNENGNKNQNENNNKTEKEQDEREPKSEHKFLVRHHWWIDALLFIGGTILLGGLATLLGGKMFNFDNYDMPPATAPKIVFPIAWSIIYIAIGVSTFLMWRDKDINSKDRKINLILYFVHMFFNVLWPLWFFRLDLPIFAVIWLVFVVASAAVVMYRYFVCNLPAGIIFNIYTLWLIYAMYLNLGLVLINF